MKSANDIPADILNTLYLVKEVAAKIAKLEAENTLLKDLIIKLSTQLIDALNK